MKIVYDYEDLCAIVKDHVEKSGLKVDGLYFGSEPDCDDYDGVHVTINVSKHGTKPIEGATNEDSFV